MRTRTHVNKLKSALAGMQESKPQPQIGVLEQPSTPAASVLPPSRRGKRIVSAYVDPAVSQQLRLLAITQDASVQGLVEEALNDLFRKYGKSAVA